MTILWIILAIILGIPFLLFLIFLIEPAIISLVFSWFLSLFVKNPPYVSMEEEFPEGKLLKENWKTIRAELDQVLEHVEDIPRFHEVDKLQRFISAKDDIAWRTFIIKGYDVWLDENAAQVPKTSELIRQLPRVNLAMFSIIDGGKHIPPHYGFFKSILRYHLGLMIPEGEVFIEVSGERYYWKEGEDVLFDDTYRHQVWNRSDGRRVVLFLNVMRKKGLSPFMQKVNSAVFAILRRSKKLQQAAKNAEVARPVED
jgi:aspartyl/asparaginyl beta-hydroxylase (cupin superfamily)